MRIPPVGELVHPVPRSGRIVAGILHRHHVVGPFGTADRCSRHVVVDMQDQETRSFWFCPGVNQVQYAEKSESR